MVANISNYLKQLDHPRKVLIIIQNINSNYLFKWYFVRADSNPARIRQVEKFSESILDFKEIKVPVKFRDFQKIEEKNCISVRVSGYETKKNIQSISQNILSKDMLIWY